MANPDGTPRLIQNKQNGIPMAKAYSQDNSTEWLTLYRAIIVFENGEYK